jgi:imidazolonepropionase-like amidohydrolase
MLGAAACAGKPEAAACSLAIEHVSVVPMDAERVLTDQTVRLEGARIASVQSASRPGVTCARRVDGRGKYLLPGLNDMHMHVESTMFAEAMHAPVQPIPFEDVLYNYLSHGVTGVRVMSGAPDILAFRNSSHGPAPRMLVASPMLAGSPAMMPAPVMIPLATPGEAVAAVNAYADAGYDFIKIRESVTPEVLAAIVDTANTRHLDVDGHLPHAVADPFVTGQRGVAHVDELSLRVRDINRDPADIAHRLHACHCYVTTTLTVEQGAAAQLRDYDAMAARPEGRFVYPLMRQAMWVRERNSYLLEHQDPAFFEHLLETDKVMVRALAREGVPIMAGTDAMIPMVIPGDSLHDELALLVSAGLSPYDAIRAATRTPSEIFARFHDLGVVAPARAANLILVSGNPLRSVTVLRRPEAVIVEGVYLDRAGLDRHMEELTHRWSAP